MLALNMKFAKQNMNLTSKQGGTKKGLCYLLALVILSGCATTMHSQSKLVSVADGWANNSINTVVFRKNSLVSFGETQYISFYDNDSHVVIGKRNLNSEKWELKKTTYKGNTKDAHNTISIMVDGDGYLHLAWDHHNNALRYCKSVAPGSLEMTDKMPMTGMLEDKVSYPEFHKLPNGNLLFMYRDGGSGKGNLVIHQYNLTTKKWSQIQSNLVDGEGTRNAYWQACVDSKGTIHLSWVWRESPDVASNHDLCYAMSDDGGVSWKKSTGEKYQLPINAATAEYVMKIPQQSQLINQTSMYADADGHPYIATYWKEKDSEVPQYHLVYNNNGQWQMQNLNFRKTAFSLSGAGTKKIPISRPQVIAWNKAGIPGAAVIFRNAERGDKVSVAINKNLAGNVWKIEDLTSTSVGNWEPTYDTELWKNKNLLHLFVEKVEQVDGEGTANLPPQPIQVLEYKIKN
ncbi:BNR repeat-containing protein [soil metagenome]